VTAAVVVLAVAGLSAVLLRRRHRSAERASRARLEAAVGFTVDIVAVVVGSGGTIRQAIAAVVVDGPEPVRPIFGAVLDRAAGGVLLADALAAASAPLGPAFHPLIGALVSGEADGAPLSAVLARLGDDAASRARWRAEAAAGRLSVALLPPLVLCLLPAVVIGAVVPLAVVALRQLRL
jgi:Flp pilus assembly protein TadB